MKRYPFKSLWKRGLAGIFDAVGGVCSLPWRSRRKPLDLTAVRRILVIRSDHIGDVVMSRPAIRALHKKFPHAAIDLLVAENIAPLFEHSKEVRTVIATHHGWFNRKASWLQKWSEFWRLIRILRVAPYDMGIDLRGDVRNILLMVLAKVKHTIGYGIAGGGFLLSEEVPYDAAQHQVRLNLKLLNSFHIAPDNRLLPFEYTPDTAQKFWTKIETLPPTTLLPRVAIHMGSGYSSKRWPIENFRALIQKIDREALAQIVLIGTETEKGDTPGFKPKELHAANFCHPCESKEPENGSTSAGEEGGLPTCGNDLLLETLNSERLIDLRGKTELRDLPVLLDVCDIFVGNDSGPAHIAAAQGLEILLLASGTNDIQLWYPWTERLSLLQHEVPCSPCGLEICPVEGHPCVNEITVDQVLNAFLSVLRRLEKRS